MASKGMKNLFGGLFGGKPKQDERSKNTPPNVTAPRAREKEMIALLDKLELDHPQNKLSREKMEELNIQGVINYARSELHFPFITEFDTKNLDANMKQIIAELKRAVEEGYEMTAEWACTALVCAIIAYWDRLAELGSCAKSKFGKKAISSEYDDYEE